MTAQVSNQTQHTNISTVRDRWQFGRNIRMNENDKNYVALEISQHDFLESKSYSESH